MTVEPSLGDVQRIDAERRSTTGGADPGGFAVLDTGWKYVSVRRDVTFVEVSIDRSTQWAVCEPNGERPC